MNFIATEKIDPYVGDLETHIYNASSQIAKSLELLADFESNNAEETNRVREVVAAPTLKSHENEVKYWNKLVQKLPSEGICIYIFMYYISFYIYIYMFVYLT